MLLRLGGSFEPIGSARSVVFQTGRQVDGMRPRITTFNCCTLLNRQRLLSSPDFLRSVVDSASHYDWRVVLGGVDSDFGRGELRLELL